MTLESLAIPSEGGYNEHGVFGRETDRGKVTRQLDRHIGRQAWQGHECGQHRHVKRVSISRSLGCNSRSDAAGSPGMIEATAWYGIAAPKDTSSEIVDKLNKEINAGLADPKIKARLADLAGAVIPGSPADFGKLVAEEIEKWGKVVKFSGAKPE
jgi:hypothetical protein